MQSSHLNWFMCVFWKPWSRRFLVIAKSLGNLDCSEGGFFTEQWGFHSQWTAIPVGPFVSVNFITRCSIYLRKCQQTREVSIVKNRTTWIFAAGWFDMILWIHWAGPTPMDSLAKSFRCKLTTLTKSTRTWNQFALWVNQIWATLKHWNNMAYLGIILQIPTTSFRILSRHSLTQPTGRLWVSVISKPHWFQQWSSALAF